jgi:hypothetical protein
VSARFEQFGSLSGEVACRRRRTPKEPRIFSGSPTRSVTLSATRADAGAASLGAASVALAVGPAPGRVSLPSSVAPIAQLAEAADLKSSYLGVCRIRC